MKLSHKLALIVALFSAISGADAKNTRGATSSAAATERNLKVDEEYVAASIATAIAQLTSLINNVDAKATAAINAVDAKADAVTTKAEMNAADIASNKAAIKVNDDKLYGITGTVVDKITADIVAHDGSSNPHANSVGEFIHEITSIKYP